MTRIDAQKCAQSLGGLQGVQGEAVIVVHWT